MASPLSMDTAQRSMKASNLSSPTQTNVSSKGPGVDVDGISHAIQPMAMDHCAASSNTPTTYHPSVDAATQQSYTDMPASLGRSLEHKCQPPHDVDGATHTSESHYEVSLNSSERPLAIVGEIAAVDDLRTLVRKPDDGTLDSSGQPVKRPRLMSPVQEMTDRTTLFFEDTVNDQHKGSKLLSSGAQSHSPANSDLLMSDRQTPSGQVDSGRASNRFIDERTAMWDGDLPVYRLYQWEDCFRRQDYADTGPLKEGDWAYDHPYPTYPEELVTTWTATSIHHRRWLYSHSWDDEMTLHRHAVQELFDILPVPLRDRTVAIALRFTPKCLFETVYPAQEMLKAEAASSPSFTFTRPR